VEVADHRPSGDVDSPARAAALRPAARQSGPLRQLPAQSQSQSQSQSHSQSQAQGDLFAGA